MIEKLAAELIAAANNEGATIKKKKILIRWQKLTERSHTIEYNNINVFVLNRGG